MKYWNQVLFFLSMLSFLPISAFCQSSVKVGYYGESIIHYGVKAGYEAGITEKQKVNKKGILVNKQLLWSANVAIYQHPHNHVGLVFFPEIAFRRTSHKRGGFYEIAVSPSLLREFYAGTTYRYSGDEFEKIPLAGRFSFLPTISVGGGRDLSIKKDKALLWYWRASYMRQYPYNIGSLPRIAIELGIIKKLNKK